MTNTSDQRAILIASRLKQIGINELNLTAEEVAPLGADTNLIETMQLDSLRQVILLSAIEREYGCVFEPEELIGVETLGDVVRLIVDRAVEEKLHEAHPELRNGS